MALGTQPHGKMLDYEQFIDHQLARTQAKIKTTDILIGCLTLATASILVLFLEIVLDHIVGLPVWSRRIILVTGSIAAAIYSGYRIARPFLRRVSGFYAAKAIEDTDPQFKNSLINYLDLRKHREELPKRVLRAIEAKAVGDLTKIEIDTVVNQKRLLTTWYALMGVIMVVFVYYGFAPKSMLDSAKRAFILDVVRPTNTRLDSIKPGDDPTRNEVVAGTHVPFEVTVNGVRPDKVTLHYSIDGGQFYLAQDFATGKNLYDPWQTQLRNVQQSISYYVTGGDAESRQYSVKVLPAPMVTGVKLDFKFPEYTGVPPRMGVDGGAIEAIENTSVIVHARTNQPADSALLDLGKGTVYPMEVEAGDRQDLTGKIDVKVDGSYTIKFKTTGGQMNPDPVVYDIRAIKDLPPTVRFVAPEPRIKLPSNGKVALKIEAGDDYGVKSLNLSVKQGQEVLVSHDILDNKKPDRKFNGSEILDLASHKLQPGTQIEYWVVARDTKLSVSNSTTSDHQIIDIIAPLKPDELKNLDEKIQKENPPPAAEDQPKDPKDDAKPQPNGNGNDPQQKDGQADPKNGDVNNTSFKPGKENEPGEANNPPKADPNQTDKPLSADDQKKLNDLDQKLKTLSNSDSNNGAADPKNGAQPNPQPPAANLPPSSAQPSAGKKEGAQPPGDVSKKLDGPQSKQANPSNEPKQNPPGTQPNPSAPQDVSKAEPKKANQPNQPTDTPKGSKPQDTPTPKSDTQTKANPQTGNEPGEAKLNSKESEQNKDRANKSGDTKPGEKNSSENKAGTSKPTESRTSKNEPGDSKPEDSKTGDKNPSETKPGFNKPGVGQASDNKGDKPKPGDAKSGVNKPGDAKPGNAKPGDSKPGDSKPGDSKSGDTKPRDSKPSEAKPNDSNKSGDAKNGDTKATDNKPSVTKPSDGKPGEAKPGDSKPGDSKPSDSKPGDGKSGDSKPSDSKPGDGKPGDGKPSDGKPGDSKASDSKPGDSKPGDGKPGDSKASDSKPSDSKPGDAKPEDGKPSDGKTGEAKPGDSKPGDAKPGDSKPGDGKPGDAKPGDSKTGDGKPSDGKPSDSKPGDGKPSDGKPSDSKPGDAKPGDSKPGDAKPGESKPGDAKPGDAKPGDANPGDSKPEDGKPGDAKPGDGKPGDAKPGDSKPGDAKPGDSKPGDAKPGDNKPGDSKPGDGKLGDAKPGVSKPGDAKPGDAKPGDAKPGDGKPGDGKPGDGKPGDAKPGDSKPSDSKPGDGKPGDGKPGDAKPGDGKPGDGKPGDGRPGDGKPGDAKPGDGKRGDGKPGDGKPGDGKPGDGKPGDGKPGDGKPGDGKPVDSKPGDSKRSKPGDKSAQDLKERDPSELNGKPNPAGKPDGQGGREPADPGTNQREDDTKPLPPVPQRTPDGSDPSIAPDASKPLVLRKLQDLLKDEKFTPDVEKQLGMSRDEAEQFIKSFEKKEQPGPAGPGRTIDVKPEKDKVIDPTRKAPEFNPKGVASNRTERTGTTLSQDNLSGLSQGGRSAPPQAIRRPWEAYMKGLSKPKASTPAASNPATKR